jgi:hypothetical protein
MGAMNLLGIGLSYRPSRLHRLAESLSYQYLIIPENTASRVVVKINIGSPGFREYVKRESPLKVLSSEMDSAESRLIPQKRKRRGGFLEKSDRPPSSESPLTQGRHLVQ